ncbi:hypothetical protein D3C85_1535990 [compost metagenome]
MRINPIVNAETFVVPHQSAGPFTYVYRVFNPPFNRDMHSAYRWNLRISYAERGTKSMVMDNINPLR